MVSRSDERQYFALEFAIASVAVTTAFLGCSYLGLGRTEWDAGDLRLAISAHGRVVRLIDSNTGRDNHADGVDWPQRTYGAGRRWSVR